MITNVLEYLEEAAVKTPDKILFADEKASVTYSELVKRAKSVGSYIARRIGKTNKPVAVLIDRNIHSLIGFMGVIYSGNFYAPVDVAMPSQRVELILQTLQPVLILDAAEKVILEGRELTSLEEAEEEKADMRKLSEIRKAAIDTDPLYAIFTSGSTGIPKGVLVNHRSIVDLAEQFADTFAFPAEPVFGNLYCGILWILLHSCGRFKEKWREKLLSGGRRH